MTGVQTCALPILLAPWPEYDDDLAFPKAHARMATVMEVTRTIRYLRTEVQLPPGKKVRVVLLAGSEQSQTALNHGLATLQRLAAVEEAQITLELVEKPKQALTAVVGDIEIYLPLAGVVDLQQELARLEKELKKMDGEIARAEGKLSNAGFIAKAPVEVVAEERAKVEEYRQKRDKVHARIETLR